MNELLIFLNHPVALKWGWVLLHFLWQGLLVSLVAWGLLAATAGKSARLRYLLATGCLFLTLLCPLAAWFSLEQPSATVEVSRENVDSVPPAPSTVSQNVTDPSPIATEPDWESSVADSFRDVPKTPANSPPVADSENPSEAFWKTRLESSLPWIVSAWLLGVLILSMRLAGGWFVARKCVSQGVPLREEWALRVPELIARLNLSRCIRWVESSRVRVPQVMGWFKPVVLVPSSMFTTLSPAEIECLLLHELVHIRRYDFVVNLMQCVIETVFFYHPGVRWLSRRIRLERELACDEAVVSLTEDKLTFSRALLSLADLAQLPQPTLAATEGDLTARIRAVLGLQRSGSASGVAVWLCLAGLLIISGIIFIAGQKQNELPEVAAESSASESSIERFVEDGIPVPDLSGKVVDPEGTPISGAVVYLRQAATWSAHREGQFGAAILARTTTDRGGQFQFTEILNRKDDRFLPNYDLITLKSGFSLGWKHLRTEQSLSKVTLKLKSPASVTGQVTDVEGKPIADATVRLKHLMSIRHITQADLEEGRWPSWKDSNYVVLNQFPDAPETTTDADGQFELTGLVADRGVFLEIAHPEYLLKNAYGATVTELDPETAAKSKRDVQTGDISISLEPGYRVRLKVVDDETGELIPNVRYANTHLSYGIPPRHFDVDGVIEIDHLTSPKFSVLVYPPVHSKYLAYSNYLNWPTEERLKEIEVRLKKGVSVQGKVISQESKLGVAEADITSTRAGVTFAVNTPRLNPPLPVKTDSAGNFTIFCPEGVFQFLARGRVRGFVTGWETEYRSREIRVTSDGPDKEPVIELIPAPRFRLVVKNPQGEPVEGADIQTRARSSLNSSHHIQGVTNHKGEYLLDELYMESVAIQDILPEEVVIRNSDNTLGAQLLLQRPGKEDPLEQRIDVTLQGLGSVEGRAVSARTGKPVGGAKIVLYKRKHNQNGYLSVAELASTGSDGRFHLRGVLPGEEHFLSLSHTRYEVPNGDELRFTLTDENRKDWGDINLKDLSPPNVPDLDQVAAPDVSGLPLQQAFDKLESSYRDALKTYRDEWETLRKNYSYDEIVPRRHPDPPYCAAFMKLAQRDPQGDQALQACLLITKSSFNRGIQKPLRELRTMAGNHIRQHFLDRAEIQDCLPVAIDAFVPPEKRKYGFIGYEDLVAAYEKLLKVNPHRDVHARAAYYVADRLMQELLGRNTYGPSKPSPKTIELCREFLLKLEREYPEYDHFLYGTYGKAADRLLFDLETMLVGKTPPDLVAKDITGKEVKLSDYRGKLVIVDFWSSRMNDNPATDGYSSLQAILEKAGDRVAVLGVVASSKEVVRQEIEEHEMYYPVYADGEQGPLFKLWNIHAWPTLFLLDENGAILYRGGRGQQFENLLLEKLAEQKQARNE